jgi:hypothetical protein
MPPDGATVEVLNVRLTWVRGRPDPDILIYDVYLEANDTTPDRLICHNAYGVGAFYYCDARWLDPDTHYYWKVIATDKDGAATSGPVWDFSTGSLESTVQLVPERSTIGVGENLQIDVAIPDAANLVAYEFTITFDPSVVHVQGVEDGGFLGTAGGSVTTLGPDIDIETGSVTFGALTMGSEQGPSGPGVLATVSLTAVGVGSSPLNLYEAQTFDTAANPQTVAVQDGSVTVEGATHDSQ